MKKLAAVLAATPALSLAHESYTMGELQHALEHNMSNPVAWVVVLAVVAGAVQLVRKVWK